MAEFCLNRWNELNGTNATDLDFEISFDLALCEGCGKYRHIILGERDIFEIFLFWPFILMKNLVRNLCDALAARSRRRFLKGTSKKVQNYQNRNSQKTVFPYDKLFPCARLSCQILNTNKDRKN